jgi:hypothetical protein
MAGMNESPSGVALGWVQAVNTKQIDRLMALSSDTIEIVGPRGSVVGLDVLREWMERAGLTFQNKRIFVENNAVVIEQHGIWRSSETGDVVGEAGVTSLFKVQDGRVSYYQRFDALHEALAAAGMDESHERVAT